MTPTCCTSHHGGSYRVPNSLDASSLQTIKYPQTQLGHSSSTALRTSSISEINLNMAPEGL